MSTQTYWALVKTVPGSYMRVTVNADSAYNAYQMLIAMYTKERLLSEFAVPV